MFKRSLGFCAHHASISHSWKLFRRGFQIFSKTQIDLFYRVLSHTLRQHWLQLSFGRNCFRCCYASASGWTSEPPGVLPPRNKSMHLREAMLMGWRNHFIHTSAIHQVINTGLSGDLEGEHFPLSLTFPCDEWLRTAFQTQRGSASGLLKSHRKEEPAFAIAASLKPLSMVLGQAPG